MSTTAIVTPIELAVQPWQAAERARLDAERNYWELTTRRICVYCGTEWRTTEWLACPGEECHDYSERMKAI